MENPIESIDSVSQRSAVKQVAFYFGLALLALGSITYILFKSALDSKDATIEVLKSVNANQYKELAAKDETIKYTVNSYKELVNIVSPAFQQMTLDNKKILEQTQNRKK